MNLYRCEQNFQIAIESEKLIDRLTGLWENEYYKRKKREEQLGIMNQKFQLADSLRLVEQGIGLQYADSLGRQRKRTSAWKKIAIAGASGGFVAGVLSGGAVVRLFDSLIAWVRE